MDDLILFYLRRTRDSKNERERERYPGSREYSRSSSYRPRSRNGAGSVRRSPARPDLRFARPDLRSSRPDIRNPRPDLRSVRPKMRSITPDLRFARPDLPASRQDFRVPDQNPRFQNGAGSRSKTSLPLRVNRNCGDFDWNLNRVEGGTHRTPDLQINFQETISGEAKRSVQESSRSLDPERPGPHPAKRTRKESSRRNTSGRRAKNRSSSLSSSSSSSSSFGG